MASSSNRGGGYYGAAPYRSREGLSTRQGAGSDEIQLRIDPMHADLDDEISGLRKQVRQLRNVASEIESEAKYQNEFINQLEGILLENVVKNIDYFKEGGVWIEDMVSKSMLRHEVFKRSNACDCMRRRVYMRHESK
ncbi:hypothetical protein E3N88_22335 [Mikania micrantha]|uniref:t-SNARE coiled-coil homology domain-containing protein n=1 Tax=Mikania micrantha TaxID=192012 RepID=A0A5N6NCQ1_9ASTR|nr:hypothetical protein E3N88_22286 [Mikania micrantha]KAD4584734.1 hypothetical protein E3N88_22335 [Mikania micrantha]